MFKGLCRKFYALLRKEAVHENEPQRILFLLRIILLILGLYFLIIPLVFCIVGPKTEVWTGYIFAAMAVAAFYATYRLKVHTSVLVCSGLQLAWIIVFVVLYGWDCGIQHLMFEMLVLVYFAVYNSLVYKVSYTVVLFAVRFSLFLYCRVNISVFALTETATVVLQIINTIVTFVLMAVACSMFSSNVESAEKKLVLYNEQLKKQIPVCNFNFTDWMKKQQPFPFLKGLQDKLKQERPERYKDVPLVVAPGQEEAYLKSLEEKKQTDAEEPEQVHQETVQPEKEPEVMQETGVHPVNDLSETPASNGNTGGWEDLLGTLGLSGMGDIAGNLGYVMAMLPDILLGVFTGKTQSLNIKDNLLPIASIVAGMFVRNPLLKMLLIGLGGANLLNKAGHEVLRERSEGEMNTANRGAAQYRHYPDEPLNPRITNPVLQGNMLVATIDRVPCTIQLSQTVTDAYRAGALPLNTLANAVLARSEQLRQRASDNYDNGQQETIVRTRGIQ